MIRYSNYCKYIIWRCYHDVKKESEVRDKWKGQSHSWVIFRDAKNEPTSNPTQERLSCKCKSWLWSSKPKKKKNTKLNESLEEALDFVCMDWREGGNRKMTLDFAEWPLKSKRKQQTLKMGEEERAPNQRYFFFWVIIPLFQINKLIQMLQNKLAFWYIPSSFTCSPHFANTFRQHNNPPSHLPHLSLSFLLNPPLPLSFGLQTKFYID